MRNRPGVWSAVAVALSLCLAFAPAAALADEVAASTAASPSTAQTAQTAVTSQSATTAQAATTEQAAQTAESVEPATVSEPETAVEPSMPATAQTEEAAEPSESAAESEEMPADELDGSIAYDSDYVEAVTVEDEEVSADVLQPTDEPGITGDGQGMALTDLIAQNDLSAQATNTTVKIQAKRLYDQAFEVFRIINAERKKIGVDPLIMDKKFLAIAMQRSAELSVRYSYFRPNGETWGALIPSGMGLAHGESTIAANYRSAKAVVDEWLNPSSVYTPSKKGLLLSEYYNIIGVGCTVQSTGGIPYWTVCMAQTSSGTPDPVSQPANSSAVFTMSVSSAFVPANRFFMWMAPDAKPDAFTKDTGFKEEVGKTNYIAAFFSNPNYPSYPTRISGQCLNVSTTNSTVWSIQANQAVKNVTNGYGIIDVRLGSVYVDGIAGNIHVPVTRLGGNTALDTMGLIVNKGWAANSGGTVVLATNDGYWDALSASGIAGLAGKGAVLLTNGTSLSTQAREQLSRIKPSKIIVCGGKAAISDGVKSAAASAAGISASKAIRVSGATATATAAAIARQAASITGAKWSDTAFITTNDGYWDALSVSPASYALKMPIFLTEGSRTISSTTISAMKAVGIKNFYVVGGTAAVPDSIKNKLENSGIHFVKRLSGATAVKTSTVVANWEMSHGMQPSGMAIATNDGYWDALTGAALCGKAKAPLLLVSDYDRSSLDFAGANKAKIKGAYVFGGTASVSSSTYNALVTQLV